MSSLFSYGRSTVVLCTVWLLALGACGPPRDEAIEPPSAEESPPNVLIISLDTLRPDHLGVYGYPRDTSPALDAFAAEAVVFDHAYAPSPSTVPSHATLFTGLLPSQHRTTTYKTALVDQAVTLSERFAEQGYRTFAVSSSIRFPLESGFHQGYEHWLRVDDLPKNDRSRAVTDAALERIQPSAVAAAQPGSEPPFFGFLHYFGSHEPYAPPEPFRSRWHPGLDELKPEDTSEYLQAHLFAHHDVPERILEYLIALYDGEILYLDQELGRLFQGLKKAGFDRNTLVIILSDHGDGFRENGRLSHSVDLNEELLRVPMIVRWPEKLAPGRESRVVGLVDLKPTILELLGLEIPSALGGRSFASWLTSGDEKPVIDPPVVDPQMVIGQVGRRWSITAEVQGERFKLETFPNGSQKLFRLSEDPWATADVSADFPEAAEDLLVLAQAYFAGAGYEGVGGLFDDGSEGPAETVVDAETLERLKAIGYAGEIDD